MSEIVYDGFHKVEKLDIDIKGKTRTIEKLSIKSAVAGIVIDAEGKIALVKQFRPCVGKYLYEIPAGLMDKKLSSENILLEELEEECDIKKSELKGLSPYYLSTHYMICGSSDAELRMYVVELETVKTSQKVDDADVEEVVWVTPSQLDFMFYKGDIADAKTLIAYYYLQSYKINKKFSQVKQILGV
jgi:ADP-ribose pyrophosphatase